MKAEGYTPESGTEVPRHLPQVHSLTTDRLSTFRTTHRFQHFAEFTSLEDFQSLTEWAREHEVPVFILGNGSNTLFCARRVRALVLKNRLAKRMDVLGDGRIEATSSLPIASILKYCQENSLDSFYYLASVPATVGGAVAMNAGRGRKFNMSVFDFIESVTYYDGDSVITRPASEIDRDYRWTIFTGVQDKLVLSAVFRFPQVKLDSNKIKERIEYSHSCQDHSAPNCGSVFKRSWGPIMGLLRGIGSRNCRYSPKTRNWILCASKSSRGIVWLIRLAKALHLLALKRAKVEFICVR